MWNKNIICILCLSMLWTIIIKSNNQISVLTTHRVKSNSSHLMNSHAHYLYTCSIFSKYFKTPHRNQSTLLNFDIISRIAGLHRFRTKKIYDTCATWRINPSLNQHTTQWLKYQHFTSLIFELKLCIQMMTLRSEQTELCFS